jgi:hypothetical protein
MYSYEARIRAVQLCIKLGLRIGVTLRQLGYPTKNALKSWHHEFERYQDLSAAQGHLFYRSENNVWLTDHVPTKYLSVVKQSRSD